MELVLDCDKTWNWEGTGLNIFQARTFLTQIYRTISAPVPLTLPIRPNAEKIKKFLHMTVPFFRCEIKQITINLFNITNLRPIEL